MNGTHPNQFGLRDLLREYAELHGQFAAYERSMDAEHARRNRREALLEAFLRDNGFTVADAEAAWKAKGYG